jgi:hypothetical protein
LAEAVYVAFVFNTINRIADALGFTHRSDRDRRRGAAILRLNGYRVPKFPPAARLRPTLRRFGRGRTRQCARCAVARRRSRSRCRRDRGRSPCVRRWSTSHAQLG